jgi:hypothetical protein
MANEIMRRIGLMDCNITEVYHQPAELYQVIMHEGFISIDGNSFDRLSLTDLQGRLVASSFGNTIKTSNLRPGIYLLSGYSSNRSIQQKVLIR